MRRVTLALVFSLLLLPFQVWSAQTDSKDAEIRAFADSIYKLLDEGKYTEMYSHFHSSMKAQATQAQWVELVKGVMQRTGAIVERRFKEHQSSIGAHVVRFDSRYQNGKALDEIYVIDEGGTLSVSGIFVKPAL